MEVPISTKQIGLCGAAGYFDQYLNILCTSRLFHSDLNSALTALQDSMRPLFASLALCSSVELSTNYRSLCVALKEDRERQKCCCLLSALAQLCAPEEHLLAP